MKKVSVIIPAYNKAELTVKTVESVLDQTYGNIEIIVVDDGSTDDTKERLTSYAGRIEYIYKENGGACAARNLGIKKARGEYLAFIDCDDIYLPRKIEKAVECFNENPRFGFVHTPVYFIDEKGRSRGRYPRFQKVPSGWISKKLLQKNFVCNSTVVVRKTCFEKTGLFDEKIFTPADWDMWLRLAERYQAGYIPVSLTGYRKSDSYIARNLEQSKREMLMVLEKAFERNPELPENYRKRLISNVYYRQALAHVRAEDMEKAKSEIETSLEKYRFNLKTLMLAFAIMIFREKVSIILK